MNYTALRNQMVDSQLIPRGIADQKVLAAFRKVPRHLFVPENIRGAAYDDCALPIGKGQTISQPYMVAIMTELLKLKGNETVLEVGTGSGYQSALLAELSKKVYTIEYIEALSGTAEKLVKGAGYNNVEFIVGDGTEGFPPASPYAGIMVTAGCPDTPKPLIEQLKDRGRLVLPVGDRYSQILTIITKHGTEIQIEESAACVFVPLVGKYGWNLT